VLEGEEAGEEVLNWVSLYQEGSRNTPQVGSALESAGRGRGCKIDSPPSRKKRSVKLRGDRRTADDKEDPERELYINL